ncbi:MAG: hypothetical protein LAT68_13535 [Cyclobacteriaceae bacterium]|nr:hypothetical protein [Cyclobacteriaceae bacterium]
MNKSGGQFSERLALFSKVFKSTGGNLSESSKKLGWPKPIAKLYATRFHILSEKEIQFLDSITSTVDEEVLGAICMVSDEVRKELISNFEIIQNATNPFIEIDTFVNDLKEKHPLEYVSTNYWKLISKYLKEREIDKYPFNKNAIRFIGSVGINGGFASQSEKQRSWILGLMKADKNGFDINPIFTNDIVKVKGYSDDLKIIKDYIKCL